MTAEKTDFRNGDPLE